MESKKKTTQSPESSLCYKVALKVRIDDEAEYEMGSLCDEPTRLYAE